MTSRDMGFELQNTFQIIFVDEGWYSKGLSMGVILERGLCYCVLEYLDIYIYYTYTYV